MTMVYIDLGRHLQHMVALATALGAIDTLAADAQRARDLPDTYADRVRRLSVHGDYDNRAKATVEDILQRTIIEERARGQRERDETLARIARESEAVRVTLPGLAAAAAIELGVISREIAREANHDV